MVGLSLCLEDEGDIYVVSSIIIKIIKSYCCSKHHVKPAARGYSHLCNLPPSPFHLKAAKKEGRNFWGQKGQQQLTAELRFAGEGFPAP